MVIGEIDLMSKILLTGGSGLLGTELRRIMDHEGTDYIAPTHKEMDFTNEWRLHPYCNCDLIVHCGAYTDVSAAEYNKELCYRINVLGTRNLFKLDIPMVYISTDGVFDGTKGNYSEDDDVHPINYYGFTKLLGEYECGGYKNLTIRTSFKPSPFEHRGACIDQFTSGDYVDIIAEKVWFAIKHKESFGRMIHIGTKRKSVYELAKITNERVEKIMRSDVEVRLPGDISLNTAKYDKICALIKENLHRGVK